MVHLSPISFHVNVFAFNTDGVLVKNYVAYEILCARLRQSLFSHRELREL